MYGIKKEKLIRAAAGIIAAAALFFCAGLNVPVLDRKTDAYFQQAITKAGIAYATCRAVNASVSIIKDSSLHMEPAGVGVSLAVGQVLDPIDDMTERLSDVLVTAITSLGVQKLAYEMGIFLVPPVLAVCILLFVVLSLVENERVLRLRNTAAGFIFILAAFRFCLPLSSLASQFIQQNYFDIRISEAREQLSVGSAGLEKLMDISLPQIDGILGTIENSKEFLKEKTREFKDTVSLMVKDMAKITDSLLTLTFLYVGVFLIQVILLPLASFWLLYKLADIFLRYPTPGLQRQS